MQARRAVNLDDNNIRPRKTNMFIYHVCTFTTSPQIYSLQSAGVQGEKHGNENKLAEHQEGKK